MFEACALSSAIIHPSGSNNVDTDRETNKRDKAEVHDAHVFFPDQVERVESSFRFSSHYACRLLFFQCNGPASGGWLYFLFMRIAALDIFVQSALTATIRNGKATLLESVIFFQWGSKKALKLECTQCLVVLAVWRCELCIIHTTYTTVPKKRVSIKRLRDICSWRSPAGIDIGIGMGIMQNKIVHVERSYLETLL